MSEHGACEVCGEPLSETERWVYEVRCSGCVTERFLDHRRDWDWRPPEVEVTAADGGPYDPARYADSDGVIVRPDPSGITVGRRRRPAFGPSPASIEQFVEAHTSDPGELLRDIQAARRRVAEREEGWFAFRPAVLSPAQAEDLERWRRVELWD